MAKKQATYGKYTVIVNDDNSVIVKNNGKECEVAKDALREISASAKFKIDADWNTRQLGSKLVDFLNENKPAAKPVAPKAEPKSENKNEISAISLVVTFVQPLSFAHSFACVNVLLLKSPNGK